MGGVAFGGVAAGQDDLKVVALAYLPKNIDGKRLQVTVESTSGVQTKLTPKIYDWELIPIARFAQSEQDACFTLFGDLDDKEEKQLRIARGEKILNYHPALSDTLLGLRLFQADILILRSDACDLPMLNGKYLLGKGEAPVNLRANKLAQSQYVKFQNELIRQNNGTRFQSYVICDTQQKISFRVSSGDLKFTGGPIWHCWRLKSRDAAEAKKVQADANTEANRILNIRFQNDQLTLGAQATQKKWTKAYQQKVHHEIFDKYISSKLLVQMPKFSMAVSREIEKQGGINPAVYNSLLVTMHYAALFRHFKAEDPNDYADFVKRLRDVKIEPQVETPTVMIDPGN